MRPLGSLLVLCLFVAFPAAAQETPTKKKSSVSAITEFKTLRQAVDHMAKSEDRRMAATKEIVEVSQSLVGLRSTVPATEFKDLKKIVQKVADGQKRIKSAASMLYRSQAEFDDALLGSNFDALLERELAAEKSAEGRKLLLELKKQFAPIKAVATPGLELGLAAHRTMENLLLSNHIAALQLRATLCDFRIFLAQKEEDEVQVRTDLTKTIDDTVALAKKLAK